MTTRRLSLRFGRNTSGGCSILFFVPFLLAGLGFACFIGWSLVQDLLVYQVYVEGACKITAKELLESSDEDGTTYAPHFEYRVLTQDGQTYAGSGYRRSLVYSSGRRGKEEILAKYKVERSYACWYNPNNPAEAVLERGFSWGWGYLIIIVPLVFVAVGGGGIWYGIANWGKSTEAMTERVTPNKALAEWLPDLKTKPGDYLDVRLPVQSSHGQSLVGIIIMTLFWNGIVSVFVIIGLTQDDFPFFVWLFLIPFILIGLYLIYKVFRQTLTWIMGGESIVEVSEEPLHFGQTADIYVKHKGEKKIQEVQVKIVCQEWVRYRQGTDTRTEQRPVYEAILFEQAGFLMSGRGDWQQSLPATIPVDAMHTFKAGNNAIKWHIAVLVKLAEAPDFTLEFPLRVVPPGVQTSHLVG